MLRMRTIAMYVMPVTVKLHSTIGGVKLPVAVRTVPHRYAERLDVNRLVDVSPTHEHGGAIDERASTDLNHLVGEQHVIFE